MECLHGVFTCSVFLRGQSRSPLRVGKHSIKLVVFPNDQGSGEVLCS
jgi:hypothetical protein